MRSDLIVNLSPRAKGASALLAGLCAERLERAGHIVRRAGLHPCLSAPGELCEAIDRADALIFSGPSYINTYPADATALLSALAARWTSFPTPEGSGGSWASSSITSKRANRRPGRCT